MYRVLISVFFIFSLSADNFNSFVGAIRKGNLERVKRYIDTVDINKRKWGVTPLYIAVHFEQKESVIELLKRDCDVNALCGSKKRTALHKAVSKKNKELVVLLVDKADINISNKMKETPLHTAIIEDCEEIARILVQKGADVHLKGDDGISPIEIAQNFKRAWAADLLSF